MTIWFDWETVVTVISVAFLGSENGEKVIRGKFEDKDLEEHVVLLVFPSENETCLQMWEILKCLDQAVLGQKLTVRGSMSCRPYTSMLTAKALEHLELHLQEVGVVPKPNQQLPTMTIYHEGRMVSPVTSRTTSATTTTSTESSVWPSEHKDERQRKRAREEQAWPE
ncbi:unnamed protein product [Mortierella alpina]